MDKKHETTLEELIKYMKRRKESQGTSIINYEEISPEDKKKLRFRSLIHLVLSARAKDATISKAMDDLEETSKGFTAEWLSKADTKVVSSIISHIPSFHKKGCYIKRIADVCVSKYDGDIPQTYDELLELPGVGIKSATIAMEVCWNKQVGVGVDTHVHRVANRLGFVKTKTPEESEKDLEEVIPKDKWADCSNAMYLLGQEICVSRKPKCKECPILSCKNNKNNDI